MLEQKGKLLKQTQNVSKHPNLLKLRKLYEFKKLFKFHQIFNDLSYIIISFSYFTNSSIFRLQVLFNKVYGNVCNLIARLEVAYAQFDTFYFLSASHLQENYVIPIELYSFIMSGFFGKLKQVFGSKAPPKFKQFEPVQLKMVAMRTRLVMQARISQHQKHITHNDQQFRYVGQDPTKIYNILQAIGEKVVQVQSMKILIQMMKKVQNMSAQIVKTNGDITLMRKELLWFQCVLWFRKTREITNLQQLYNFCLDFFKGVDITTQLNVKCEVFQLYPILKFLKKGEVLPLREILFYIQPYVSCNIQQSTLDNVFRINSQQIKKKVQENLPNKQKFSTIPQNKTSYSQIHPQNNIYTPYTPPQQSNKSSINPYQNSSDYQQPNTQFNLPNNFTSPHSNTFNVNHNSFNPNNQKPSNQINKDPVFNPNQMNHNTQNVSSNSNSFSNINLNQSSTNLNQQFVPVQNQAETQQTKKQIQQKQSFYNTLLRVNSAQQNNDQESPKTQPALQEKPLNINYNYERQHQNNPYQLFQSAIPFNRQVKEEIRDDEFQRQMRDLEELQMKNNLAIQEEIKRKECQRKQKVLQEQKQREELQRYQLQAEKLRLQKIRIKQLQQQQRLKEQEQRKMQQQRKIQEEMQKRKQKEEQERRLKEEQERRLKEEQERRLKEEQERRQREQEQRERQFQARKLERQKELRQSQVQLNVFADNEREEIDRGASARFSNIFGMKIDFGQNEGEQFNFQSPEQVNTSILRFSKLKQPELDQSNKQQQGTKTINQDELESLKFIKQFSGKSTSPAFKLFYFKIMEASP